MTSTTKQVDRRLTTLIVLGVVCALTFVLAFAIGCTPAESEGDASDKKTEQKESDGGASTQKVDWTMDSDCGVCHTVEAESMTDSQCPQAVSHEDMTCIDCHTGEAVLKTAHEDITYADKPATKATVETVDEQTCIECHGTMEEMEAKTAGSTALTDDNGTSVNPHERLPGEKHEANYPTCTSCHNNHSQNLPKDAMKFCAQCHHRGVFTCGNCHSVEE